MVCFKADGKLILSNMGYFFGFCMDYQTDAEYIEILLENRSMEYFL